MAQNPPNPTEADAAKFLGQVIDGRYRIESLLGHGGMGLVFKAVQTSVQRPVALKTLHRHLADTSTFFERFKREAEVVSRLHHPNIITMYDFGQTPDGLCYFVMEFLPGQSLKERVKRQGPMTLRQAIAVMEQACAGIEHAHKQNVIHRDLKPHNIMLTEVDGSEYVKVLDFGLVKATAHDEEEDDQLTSTGQVLGTPQYMPPEQSGGDAVDTRSDLYALAAVFFYCLTGRSPYGAKSVRKALMLAMGGLVPKVATYRVGAPVPELVDALIFKGLRPEKEERFQTAKEFVQALNDSVEGLSADELDAMPRAVATSSDSSSATSGSRNGPTSKAVTAVGRPLPRSSNSALGPQETKEIPLTTIADPALPLRRSRRPLFFGIGALALLIAAGAGSQWLKPTAAPTSLVAMPAPTPELTEPLLAEQTHDSEQVAAKVQVSLETRPEGAEVFESGAFIGKTPLTLKWIKGGARTLILKLKGYRDLSRTFKPESDQTLEFSLEPIVKSTVQKKQNKDRSVTPFE
jgi:serine/threonine protein kinase